MVTKLQLNNTTLWKESKFICDSTDDLTSLPTIPEIAPGSTATVVTSSSVDVYILSNQGSWIQM